MMTPTSTCQLPSSNRKSPLANRMLPLTRNLERTSVAKTRETWYSFVVKRVSKSIKGALWNPWERQTSKQGSSWTMALNYGGGKSKVI